MNEYSVFYLDKTSNTFSDSLVAFGWSAITDELRERQGDRQGSSIIHDEGAYFIVELPTPIRLETLSLLHTHPFLPQKAVLIATAKNTESIPEHALQISYEAERDKVNQYFTARGKAAAPDSDSGIQEPHIHWDIFRAINPAALPGYNGILTDWWNVRTEQPEIVALLFDLFRNTPNDIETAIAVWKKLDKAKGWKISAETTRQQLYNPEQGKGQNRPKADRLTTGNLSGFWLLEYLKLVGFYEAALTRTVRGAKDRKTFVVTPLRLSFDANRSIMSDFAANMRYAETSTRFDILAALRYLAAALKYLRKRENIDQLAKTRRIKNTFVSGFHTAYYKDLGNAVATMNISFIALPGWVSVTKLEDIAIYDSMLEDLETLTTSLDEGHSDAFNLLQDLRDFISADDISPFFRFTRAYPAYLIGRRERNQYAFQLTTLFIERLIVNTDADRDKPLSPILQNEGFQNIAYAIRQATVIAQYRKKQGDRKYDVRYGLGQELARKARYKDDFTTALTEFLAKYNAENAQVMETRPAPYRRSIRTGDIEAVIELMDNYDPQVVANLLIAYGYAREDREGDETPIADNAQA